MPIFIKPFKRYKAICAHNPNKESISKIREPILHVQKSTCLKKELHKAHTIVLGPSQDLFLWHRRRF